MVGADAVEQAKLMYGRFLTPRLWAEVNRMDEYNQDVFWAYLYFMAPKEIDKVLVGDIRDAVEASVSPLPEDMRSARPFSAAEESISAHGLFTARRLI